MMMSYHREVVIATDIRQRQNRLLELFPTGKGERKVSYDALRNKAGEIGIYPRTTLSHDAFASDIAALVSEGRLKRNADQTYEVKRT